MHDFATRLLAPGLPANERLGASSVPVFQTSTFDQRYEESAPFEYSRSGNPTRQALETVAADLEGGSQAFAFASGIAAVSASLLLFSQGDHILAARDIYGGTHRVLTRLCPRWGIEHSFIDPNDQAQLEASLRPTTKALYLETPSNPLLAITDLKAACAWAKKHELLVIVDNTFMTPFLQRPLELGADIVVHSATKFIAGHSDVIAGLVIVKDKALAKDVYLLQNGLGAVLGPQDSWLTLRGLRTLQVRLEAAQKSAAYIAAELQGWSEIKAVYYPGLAAHPGRSIHEGQADGPGAVLSFDLVNFKLTQLLLAQVKLPAVAVSLGGVESILSHPATMSHAAIPAAERQKLGIADSLVRLSVGLESPDDLLQDLRQALQAR
ncbi:MAG: PLP-dependent transferase [Anaeromusa sp.]|uniref:trans-sulfuration enzyme family protein n=1 Tax=Anaeromusa sp. TaxID=1872520 RepID=UPI002B2076AA|nr:PLP-dependent transferase [Anaeromusa sp.]MEA4836337.1 PLP-dependent transferase [Anaeromusa sp.]